MTKIATVTKTITMTMTIAETINVTITLTITIHVAVNPVSPYQLVQLLDKSEMLFFTEFQLSEKLIS